MKARIYNQNYAYAVVGARLVLTRTATLDKPWAVYQNHRIRRFRTHAEAITYATKQVRKRKGKK